MNTKRIHHEDRWHHEDRRQHVPVSLVIAVVGWLLAPPHAGAQEWPDLFDPLQLVTLNLELDPADWDTVTRDLSFDIEVPARFFAAGEEPFVVSVRRKAGHALGEKVSLKIDINEFEDQTWHGLKKLSLENGYETDVISEGLAWYLHRVAAGASRSDYDPGLAAWVRLFVNGKYLGVYVNVEQSDKQFLKNRALFTKKKTWLYKQTDAYERELEVGTPREEALCYAPFGIPKSNLPRATDHCDTPDDDALAAELTLSIDMEAMLTLGAVSTFVSNSDALFSHGKNFCYVDFSHDSPRRRLYFPWNLHRVFTNSQQSIYGTLKGGRGPGLRQTPYQHIILGHPQFRQQYRKILEELIAGPLAPEYLHAFLDALETLLKRPLELDAENNLHVTVAERFDQLRRYVVERSRSIQVQLGGSSVLLPTVPASAEPGQTSYIEVGEARGRPGEVVEVEVIGGTHVKVNGFAFAVGMGRRITVESIELGEFFQAALGDRKHFVASVFPEGSPEPYFSVFLGFFGIDADESGVTGIAPPLVIPPDTTLVKVRYRIPRDHEAPGEQVLFNQARWYKKTSATHQMLAVRSMYTTEADVSRHGIDPTLVSGKIFIEAESP